MPNLTVRPLFASAVLSLLTLTGCDQIDPLTRPYGWQPSQANARNIAAMAANPADLIQGRSSKARRSNLDTDAIDHIWSGKPMPLLSGGGGSGGGGSSGSSGGASGGGGT
jgi:uncharacterized membrane protein YgcG